MAVNQTAFADSPLTASTTAIATLNSAPAQTTQVDAPILTSIPETSIG